MKQTRPWQSRIYLLACIAIFFAVATAAFAADSEPAVSVGGEVPKPGNWTVARLRDELATDIKAVQYTSHGQQHTANCLPLLSVLKAAGVQTELKMNPNADPKKKNAELRLIVVVQAGDGYVVTFSLGELLADIGNHPVWVALDTDGQPLAARDGPVKLIVPEDKTAARWVHAVQTISVINAANAATRPAE